MRRVVLSLIALLLMAAPALARTSVVDGGLRVATPEEVDRAAAAGVPWVSFGTSWADLEPSPGSHRQPGGTATPDWQKLRDVLVRARQHGLKMHLIVTGSPSWASGKSGPNNPPTPANEPAYAQFLGDLAREVGGEVDAWSVWNEPNLGLFWPQPDAAAYVRILKAGSAAIRAADTGEDTILAGPFVATPQAWEWLNNFYLARPGASFDVLGWNMYPAGAPEEDLRLGDNRPHPASFPGLLYLRGRLDILDPGRPVWVTELSWSTCTGGDGRCVSEAVQADYLTRAFDYRRRYLTGSVDRILWYTTRDGDDPADWFDGQGLLRVDFSAKPSYRAMQSLAVDVADPVIPGAPAAALTPPSPPAARTAAGRISLSRLRVTALRGVLTLRTTARLAGGRARLQFEGFRRGRWRPLTRVTLVRSSNVAVRVRDQGFLAVRVRATVIGKPALRASRTARVPAIRVVRSRG